MLVRHLPEIYLTIHLGLSQPHTPHSNSFFERNYQKWAEISKNDSYVYTKFVCSSVNMPLNDNMSTREMSGRCLANIYLCWNALYIGVLGMHREMLRCLEAFAAVHGFSFRCGTHCQIHGICLAEMCRISLVSHGGKSLEVYGLSWLNMHFIRWKCRY